MTHTEMGSMAPQTSKKFKERSKQGQIEGILKHTDSHYTPWYQMYLNNTQ